MKYQQLNIWKDYGEQGTPTVRRPKGNSQNPIVFHDYESYVAKFQDKEKTTDDTYTPPIFMRRYWIMFGASIRWREKRCSARSTQVETMNMLNTRRMAW